MKRILFVDDEFSVLDGIRRLLEPERTRWEMHFELAADSALDQCNLRVFDLVVADMRMPGTDGTTLLGFVRDRHPEAARVIMAHPVDAPLASRAASDAYRVLAKPITRKELVATIERIFTLQDLLCTSDMRQTMGRIGGLPSLSETYIALQSAVRDPNIGLSKVAAIIEKDVAMAAKILQLVNSGLFGLAQTISSVNTAVSYLGIETIKNLALASETFRVFVPDSCIPRSFLEMMHRHAKRTAIIVAGLPLSIKDRDAAIVAALLHDIGQLVLASRMPLPFSSALSISRERNCAPFEAEESILGISHAELGAYLLGVWGINGLTVEAVAHHHRPTRIPHEGLDSSVATYLASLIALQLDLHPHDTTGADLPAHDKESLTGLGLLAQYPVFRTRAVAALSKEAGL
jgi:HD-like signal output (HDOD) protein/ActR/RegA family two-component response regulator